jgi:hypothetical protein
VQLYPPNTNGHPFAEGYSIIAQSLLDAVANTMTMPMTGVLGLTINGELARVVVVTTEGVWEVPEVGILLENGWELSRIPTIPAAWTTSFPFLGTINAVDPAQFGPQALGF